MCTIRLPLGRALTIAIVAVLYAPATSAQGVPEPLGAAARQERALRDLDREVLSPRPAEEIERGRPSRIADDADEARIDEADDEPLFPVTRIVTRESEVLDAQALRAAVAPFEGRTLSLADVQRLVDAIDGLYERAGFRAGFAIVPDQDLAGGVLEVLLVEPRIDEVAVAGARRPANGFVSARLPLMPGSLLDLEALERSLNLLNRTSAGTFAVEALLRPGAAFGTTAVELQVREAPLVEMLAVAENFGTEETGRYRGLGVLRASNLLGGDVLQVGGSGSQGGQSGFVSYSVPVFEYVRFNATASQGVSRIRAGTFAPLGLRSDSTVAAAWARVPLLSTQRWLFSGEAGFETSRSRTRTGPLRIERRIDEVFAQVDATFYGDTNGLFASVRPSSFSLALEDNAGRSRERFTRVTGSFFAFQRFGDFELRARGDWQWTPDTLLPTAKQFTLGGPYSVRGYQTDQFSGDNGAYIGLEGRWRAFEWSTSLGRHTVTALAFADAGAALPFRANRRTPQRQDFASSIGGGLEATFLDERLTVFAGLAQPLDAVHKGIHKGQPRLLLSATLRFPLVP